MSHYERILASAPLNKTAALVTGKGQEWKPARNLMVQGYRRSDEGPLPVFPAPSDAPPLVGMRVGRLRVVGYGGGSANNGARWVVRCACGAYEHRKAKFLRSEHAKTRGMCSHCDYLENLKSRGQP